MSTNKYTPMQQPVGETYHYVANGQEFDTVEEAEEAAEKTFQNWFGSNNWAVVESSLLNGSHHLDTAVVEKNMVSGSNKK